MDRRIFGDQLRRGLHVLVGNGVALPDQDAQLLDQVRDLGGISRITFDHELVALGSNADVEEGLELAEVSSYAPKSVVTPASGTVTLRIPRRTDRYLLREQTVNENSRRSVAPMGPPLQARA